MSQKQIGSFTIEKVPLFVRPTDIDGKDETLDGPAVLSVVSGNGTSAAATAEEIAQAAIDHPELGTLVGFAIPEDVDGQSALKMEGDADLSTGTVTISDDITYIYTVKPAPQAAELNTTAGAPVAK